MGRSLAEPLEHVLAECEQESEWRRSLCRESNSVVQSLAELVASRVSAQSTTEVVERVGASVLHIQKRSHLVHRVPVHCGLECSLCRVGHHFIRNVQANIRITENYENPSAGI